MLVLRENTPMLKLSEELGFTTSATLGMGVMQVVLPIRDDVIRPMPPS